MSIPYYDCIAHHAMRQPGLLAAVDLATCRRRTYRAFDSRISRLAASFGNQSGIGAGDRVAVLAPNATDTFEMRFACGRIGAIFVPLNWRLANPEVRAIMDDCAPKILIHDPEFAARAAELAASGGIPNQISLDQPVAATLDDISTILVHVRHNRAAQGRDHYPWHEFLE